VIQEKEICRLGSTRPIQLSFRVVAATNLNLEEQIQKGEFKADLFQRLNVIPIHIPPLRERKEDLFPLAHHFLKLHSKSGEKFSFSKEVLECFMDYSWPGNAREMNNCIAYAVAMSDSDFLRIEHFPPK